MNSAERAPYLLLIEILNDDLDFDPSKRSNKEALKKIVLKENEKKGASRDLISFSLSGAPYRHRPEQDSAFNDAGVVIGEEAKPAAVTVSSPTSATAFEDDDEEIDLVEQLYGADQSLRVDLSESIVLPPAPKNKELDRIAWSRSTSVPPSPGPDNLNRLTPSLSTSSDISRTAETVPQENGNSHANGMLSLDEYSERMRTAAIMLAQLNANLVSITTGATSGDANGPKSWLPGSSWLGSSEQQAARNPVVGGPEYPIKMRLQHSEATAIRERIMKEMLALEEERMERMRENREDHGVMRIGHVGGDMKTAEDEGIIRRELDKVDPSAVVFSESWAAKKVGRGFPARYVC